MTNLYRHTNLLVIDDETAICEYICFVAEEMGLQSVSASTLADVEKLIGRSYDCIIMDLTMPDIDGVEIARLLAERQVSTPLILISGQSDRVLESASRLARERGLTVSTVLSKPILIDVLEDAIAEALCASVNSAKTGSSDQGVPKFGLWDLQRDLRAGRFVPHYQPKVDAGTGRIAAYEALIRWQHADLGILTPGSFLGLVIENGLIDEMMFALLDRVLEDARRWQDTENWRPIAINIEAASLNNLELPGILEAKVREFGLSPDMLILEVTENGVITQAIDALDNIVRFHLKGFRLSIDDFGTGHSTLLQLQKLPFDQLKIDKSFTDGIGISKDAEAIISSTVDLAHKLEMEVVAEGIETGEQAEFLKDCDCDQLQGFLFAKPLPRTEIENWIQIRQPAEMAAGYHAA